MRTMAGLAVAAVLALLMAPGVYAADGKAVFRGKCLECHSASGTGGKVLPAKYAVLLPGTRVHSTSVPGSPTTNSTRFWTT